MRTVMEESVMNEPSDAGSIPASSSFITCGNESYYMILEESCIRVNPDTRLFSGIILHIRYITYIFNNI